MAPHSDVIHDLGDPAISGREGEAQVTDVPANPSTFGPLWETFVRPFYMSLLDGSFLRSDGGTDEGFAARLGEAAHIISDDDIQQLLTEREWRGRLAAAWFVGLSKRLIFRQSIGDLLLASELVYAGQGYCLALGLIGDDQCRTTLRAYLEQYIPLKGRVYDQAWAIGALAHIEGQPPQEFLDPHLWAEDNFAMDPLRGIRHVAAICSGLGKHRLI